MKVRSAIALLLLSLTFTTYAQEMDSGEKVSGPHPEITPLVILQSAEERIEFDPAKGDTLNYSSLKPEWISSIDVLSGENAQDQFGERGINGVIIIHLNELQFVTRENLVKLKQNP